LGAFFAFIMLCGVYQGHVQACLTLQEKVPAATRSACLLQGHKLMDKAKSAAWYGGIKEPHQTKISCLVPERHHG